MAPWSLALGAIALSVPALADQAGEARNDIVGIFFLLAAVAMALNAARAAIEARAGAADRGARWSSGLAVGLAAGTKLNFLLPAAVLVVGLALVAPAGARGARSCLGGLAASPGAATGTCGTWSTPATRCPGSTTSARSTCRRPNRRLGGREAHSVLSYLTDGSVWSDWFLPGLHGGLWIIWPLLVPPPWRASLLVASPLALRRWAERTADSVSARQLGALALAGLVGLAARWPGWSPRPRPRGRTGCRAGSNRASVI